MRARSQLMVRSTIIALIIAPLTIAMAEESFRPAIFAGLKLGTATIGDAKKLLGAPKTQFRDDAGTTWVYYADVGPVPGKVEIIAKSATGIIETIELSPAKLSFREAQRLFGPNFKVVHYKFDNCLRQGDGAPLYEAADGPLAYTVYEDLGIALSVDGTDVESIQYRSKPLGTKISQCSNRNAVRKK